MKSLNEFKKEFINILKKQYDELDNKKESNFQKSLLDECGDFLIQKGRAANIGEVREWKGQKYKKIAPNKWRPIYESANRQAKQSIKKIAKKISNATTTDELMEIIMQNVNRFQDKNGRTLDIVEELKNAVNEKKQSLNAKKTTPPTTKTKSPEDVKLDNEYFDAIQKGDTEKIQQMVMDRAEKMGFKDAIPEQGNGYKIRVNKPPKKTKTVYKCFYVDTQGRPSALFVDNNAALPTNVWLNANDTWNFTAENGNKYVPTMGNATNKDANATGDSIKIPNDEVRQELIKRGYLPEGSKAEKVTCVAYRPGWHGGDLPFFPQGGKYGNHRQTQNGKENKKFNPNLPESPYKNVHRWNQVIFEIEVDADNDFTDVARSQDKAINKDGTLNYKKADLQYMPEGGMYEYTTNPEVEQMTGGKGKWVISGSIKIKRALSEEECNKILSENGMKAQEWEKQPDYSISQKKRNEMPLELAPMDLRTLGYTGTELSGARKTLAPITYDDNGKIIPLSERFDKNSDDIRKSLSFSSQIKGILSVLK